ncbi:MAG: hypothetical protein JNM79_05810 [Burkholderiales bacterium]|nr:hypothetical protein [Burkholderiales bacterium]
MTFDDLYLHEADMLPIRRELYHSHGQGFYVFRSFLSGEQTAHMRTFWSTLQPDDWHSEYKGMDRMYRGCPNYYAHEDNGGQLSYFNFLWNEPPDELTYSVAFAIQQLRNRVESRTIYREIFPMSGRSASYRIVLSRNIREIVVPHRDWTGQHFDPRRLQVTLFLAEKGSDYQGLGFGMETNDGRRVVFGDDVEIRPGDLVLWRYNNLHFAQEVSSSNGIGFMRMLMPPEAIPEQSAETRAKMLRENLKARVKALPLVGSHALPVYRKLRGSTRG